MPGRRIVGFGRLDFCAVRGARSGSEYDERPRPTSRHVFAGGTCGCRHAPFERSSVAGRRQTLVESRDDRLTYRSNIVAPSYARRARHSEHLAASHRRVNLAPFARRCWVAVALFRMLLLTAAAKAQSPVAAVGGTVSDASGAPVPGVTVSAHQQSTGASRAQQTDASGRYRLEKLDPGPYKSRQAAPVSGPPCSA